jgi:hypothetical protein
MIVFGNRNQIKVFMKIFYKKNKLNFVNNNVINLMVIIFFLLTLNSCKESKNENLSNVVEKIIVPTNGNLEGKIKNIDLGCGYNINLNDIECNIYLPDEREKKIIENIISYSGLPLNFEIFSGDINNAIAFFVNNKRYIIYDKSLLTNVDAMTNNYWSSISILAHEIGHHLSGHTLNNEIKNHDAELQADKFSGFILYKMGATQEQATNVMLLLGSEHDSDTHPNKNKRIKAILNGWNEANDQRNQGAIPPPPNDNPEDFYEFSTPMIVSSEKINNDINSSWYSINNKYLYGVITEVNLIENSFKVRVLKTTEEFNDDFRKIENEDWEINIDTYRFGEDNEMCNACESNFEALIVPGRRLKFSITEGYPGCGTAMNGIWFLTYAKAIKNNSF